MKTTTALVKRESGPGTSAHDQIAVAAYNLYLQNGQPGHELDDWLRAEQLLGQTNRNGISG